MSRADKETKARIEALSDEALAAKVDSLKQTIPRLNAELECATRTLRDRRKAAQQKAIDEARRNSR